jgi:2-oxo-3-hexenedioate decarboxylase
VNAHDVLDATAGVCAAIEVIDSRYTEFKFTLPDVVADNASSAAYVLSPRVEAADFDLALEGCLFEADGKVFGTAAGAAVMGHPAEAIAWLANELGERDRVLQGGWTILSGGLTAPAPLRAGGSVTATFARLGSLTLRVIE